MHLCGRIGLPIAGGFRKPRRGVKTASKKIKTAVF
jgi:hypothetical protein